MLERLKNLKIVKTGISDCICCTDEHPFFARKKEP